MCDELAIQGEEWFAGSTVARLKGVIYATSQQSRIVSIKKDQQSGECVRQGTEVIGAHDRFGVCREAILKGGTEGGWGPAGTQLDEQCDKVVWSCSAAVHATASTDCRPVTTQESKWSVPLLSALRDRGVHLQP